MANLFLISAFTVVAALIGYLPLALNPIDEALLSQSIQWTARYSCSIFLLVFITSSLQQLWPSPISRQAMRKRSYLGISFALAHLIHLSAIVLKVEWSAGSDYSVLGTLQDLAVPLAIYSYMLLMLITSNNWSVKTLGPKVWKGIHKVGMYLLWLGFTSSFVGRAINPDSSDWLYWLYSILLVAAWLIRVSAASQKRKQRAAISSA